MIILTVEELIEELKRYNGKQQICALCDDTADEFYIECTNQSPDNEVQILIHWRD